MSWMQRLLVDLWPHRWKVAIGLWLLVVIWIGYFWLSAIHSPGLAFCAFVTLLIVGIGGLVYAMAKDDQLLEQEREMGREKAEAPSRRSRTG